MRLPPRLVVATIFAIPVLVLAGLIGIWRESGPGTRTVVAHFAEAPGLYKDNHVEVLGIPVGEVTGVVAHPGYVTVTMQVRDNVALPAAVSALLEAPDIVNDRFVELTPVYRSGPKLAPGAVIPVQRTAIPVSTDQILRQLDTLVRDLGPNGANKHGAVARVISALAQTLGGNGPNLNKTISSVGKALGALSNDGPQVKELLDNLGTFTQSAAADSANYQAFVTDLAAVTNELASDNGDIGAALHNLQQALGALAQFVATNKTALGGTVSNLDTLLSTLASEQQQLAGTIGLAPTALSNISNAIDPSAPGGPALVSRYDPTTGSTTITNQVCGNTLLRLLILTVDTPPVSASKAAGGTATSIGASPLDVVCGFSSVIANLGAPPNSPTGPVTSLQTLAGAGS